MLAGFLPRSPDPYLWLGEGEGEGTVGEQTQGPACQALHVAPATGGLRSLGDAGGIPGPSS